LKGWALVLAATLVVVGLFATLALASDDDAVLSVEECEELAERELPDLQAQAARILADDSSVGPFADCDSGGHSSVYGGITDRPEAIVHRMEQLGDVEYVENTECLEYLEPAMCDAIWQYRPRDGDRSYTVSLPRRDSEGEFSISLHR
jgi:hypothetical protein